MDTQNLMGEDYPSTSLPTSDERTLAILSHVLGFFTLFVGPLVIYLIKKDDSTYVAEHSREALNFQLTMFILYFISGILVIILIGLLMIWALSLLRLVLVIIATIKTSENKIYRYPLTLRLIK